MLKQPTKLFFKRKYMYLLLYFGSHLKRIFQITHYIVSVVDYIIRTIGKRKTKLIFYSVTAFNNIGIIILKFKIVRPYPYIVEIGLLRSNFHYKKYRIVLGDFPHLKFNMPKQNTML